MFRIYFIVVASILPVVIRSEGECPAEYLRFNKEHSICKPENPSCSFLVKGLQDENAEKTEILKVHNNYRSRIATGQENLGGGLPTAANMIEMTWDEELQKSAQKWAEQCKFEHDCGECRASKSFSVGQNIAYMQYPCEEACEIKKADWNGTVKMWYDEVADFERKLVSSLEFTGKMIGHFTQVSWAETWKIGCGYVAYKTTEYNRNNVKQFYVCNYGPAGNMGKASMYKEGAPCTNCPKNSCCGETCTDKIVYPGLCHLESSPPIYPSEKNLFFSCAFQKNDPNCLFVSEGAEKWELVETPGGTFLSIVVKEQESATAHFKQSVRVKRGSCMVIQLRKGPNVAGERDDGNLEVEFDQNGQKTTMPVWSYPWPDFVTSPVWMDYDGDIKFSIKLTVPSGAPAQFVEIKKIEITEDACSYGTK